MKAQKYSNSFQLHEQRGSFNGIDTCSVTNYHNFALQSLLLGQYESRSIKNRPDINSMLTQLCKEKQLPPTFVDIMQSNASASDFGINIDDYIRGATYVPVDTAMQLQRESKAKPIQVIWDKRQDENLPIITRYCRRSFVITTFPLQKCNQYGSAFPSIPTFSSRNKNTSILWILSALLTRVEVLWQAVCGINKFRQTCWHGWMLTYLTKKCFTHAKMRSEKTNPFQMTFMSSVAKLLAKIEAQTNPLIYPQVPLQDLFVDIPNIICMNTLDGIREVIDTDNHDIVIVESHLDVDQSNNPRRPDRSRLSNNTSFNGVNYELRLIITVHFTDEFAYTCEAYSRHGGQHSYWWVQNRSDSICTQSTCGLYPQYDNENLESSRTIAVYIKTKNDDNSAELYQEFLSYIGGQSHIVCSHHKLPLISTVDRKNKCRCSKKEHYSCPQLDCKVCLCQKCSDVCDHSSINYIVDHDNNNHPRPDAELNAHIQEEIGSEDESDFEVEDVRGDILERDNFDDFMINGGNPDLSDDENENADAIGDDDNFIDYSASILLPSSDAGSLPMEVIDEEPKKAPILVAMSYLINAELC